MVTAALLAIGAIPAVLPAAAAEPVYHDAGQLVLTTGALDQVKYGDAVQSLSKTGSCALTSSGANLLQFRGYVGKAPKSVGFLNDSIGVMESSLTALCYKVDTISFNGSETLEVKLGSDLKSFDNTPLLAKKATLDIEVRSLLGSKAKVQATALRNGSAVGAPFVLQQGSGGCTGTENGNCTWVIAPGAPFDTLSLKPLKGSFSLEGGSDKGASPSTFDLVAAVDAVFNCEPGQEFTEGNTGVTYLGQAEGGTCVGFGISLTPGATEVAFLKPADLAPDAQFIFDIVWTVPNADASPPYEVPALTPVPFIDFEAVAGEQAMGFCPAALYSAEGELVGVQEPADLASLTDFEPSAAVPGIQYGCVGSPRNIQVTPAQTVITDKIFVIGDVKLRAR